MLKPSLLLPSLALPLLVMSAGCNEYEVGALSKELYVAPLADAGGTAVDNWVTMTVPLYSIGSAPITATSVQVVNTTGDAFVLMDSWATDDSDDDGVLDKMTLDAGSADLTVFTELEISFRPDSEGYFRATVYVDTDGNRVESIDPEEGLHDGGGVYVFQLRGIARYPQVAYYPSYIDFGRKPVGGYFFQEVEVVNNGPIMLVIAAFTPSDGSDDSFFVETPAPVYILPGDSETVEVGYIPGTDQPEGAQIEMVTNSPDEEPTLRIVGNTCEASADISWDGDDDGFFECGGDCNDRNPNSHPDAPEVNNNIDDDCDGEVDEGTDAVSQDDDNDGLAENQGDCNDDDPLVGPDAEEVANNQIDDDCDGEVDEGGNRYDDDGDGYANREGDCNDYDDGIFPGAVETADEIDNDCDDIIDEGTWEYDDDLDGFSEADGDCDDYDAWTFPDAQEDCDRIDNDCDREVDESSDGEESACSYLTEVSAPAPASSTCSSAPAGAMGLAGLMLGLVGLARRRRG